MTANNLSDTIQELVNTPPHEVAMRALMLYDKSPEEFLKIHSAYTVALALITLRDYSKTTEDFEGCMKALGIGCSVLETEETIN